MSAYTEEFLVDKLNKLVNTQESIQTLSEWVKFHKKKCKQSVEIWDRELYNANDIMQTSRKKGGEFIQEYARVLPRAILHVQRECDKDEKKSVTRLLNIWRERRVFPPDFIENINKSLQGLAPSEQLVTNVPAELDVPPTPPQNKNDPLSTLMREMTGREVEMALADEKVQAIRPQLMSGEAMVTCINQGEVTELAIELDEAITVLNGFKKSLEDDLKTRTKLIDALKAYIETQEQQKEIVQKKMQDCRQELNVTEQLKDQLKQLYEKLPPGSAHEDDGHTVDPRYTQKRENKNDVSSPEKRAKTSKGILPSPPNMPRPAPITSAIIANQSYYTPEPGTANNNLYASPTTTGIHNMHINSPIPADNIVNNSNLNVNQNYNNVTGVPSPTNINSVTNLSNSNNLNNVNNLNNMNNLNNLTNMGSLNNMNNLNTMNSLNSMNNINNMNNMNNMNSMNNMNNWGNMQGTSNFNSQQYQNNNYDQYYSNYNLGT